MVAISSAIDASARARVVGIKTNFVNLNPQSTPLLPQRVAIIGQGATASTYATTKAQYTTSAAVGSAYGFGSPVHLAARELLPVNGGGVGTIPVTIYPMVDDASGVAAGSSIDPGGVQTEAAAYIVRVSNIDSAEFVIDVAATAADTVTGMADAINSTPHMPVVATADTTPAAEKVDLVAKWKGTSGNDIYVEVVGSTTAGTTFVVTQPSGGLVNPDVDDALSEMGNVWETLVINCLEISDTTTLDKFQVFGEGRWDPLVQKPLIVFTGNAATTVTASTVISDARKTDRPNAQLVAPGSNDLPLAIASAELVYIATTANNNPAKSYAGGDATTLTPGADGDQWSFADRDSAVKKGSSTVEVSDGVIELSDVVTFYHPTGEETPPYRYVSDIVKLQNILYNLSLIFNAGGWKGAPLIPDGQATTNPEAKTPSMAKAAIAGMIDGLALNAIISDPDAAKSATVAQINGGNPNRLDIVLQVQLSGTTRIISIDANFGFFFGA